MGKSKTTEQFVADAIKVHGDRYDYSKVDYLDNKTSVCIICPEHGVFWQRPNDHLQGAGCRSCGYKKHLKVIYGIAICDILGYSKSQSYKLWFDMIRRCYNTRPFEPSYESCVVCEEWLTFSKFNKWFEECKGERANSYHLDKDILVKGNKTYSPQTCCFVPQEINKLLTKRQHCRGSLPIGVTTRRGKYYANLSKPKKRIYLGQFNSKEDAFQAYKLAKEQYIKELAEKYFQEGKITRKVYNALMKYEVEITD